MDTFHQGSSRRQVKGFLYFKTQNITHLIEDSVRSETWLLLYVTNHHPAWSWRGPNLSRSTITATVSLFDHRLLWSQSQLSIVGLVQLPSPLHHSMQWLTEILMFQRSWATKISICVGKYYSEHPSPKDYFCSQTESQRQYFTCTIVRLLVMPIWHWITNVLMQVQLHPM